MPFFDAEEKLSRVRALTKVWLARFYRVIKGPDRFCLSSESVSVCGALCMVKFGIFSFLEAAKLFKFCLMLFLV